MEKKVYYKINKAMLTAIISEKTVCPGAKIVLWSLINRLCGKNYCYPSQKTISLDTALSERSVRYHLTSLNKLGIIVWTRGVERLDGKGRANSNCYDLSKILWREK